MRTQMHDEGFHEIQLNGKQLVFLFMAATVVAVVIFLCGVMVGRGVEVQRAGITTDAPIQAGLDPTAPVQPPAATTATAGNANAPVTAQETLTYTERLEEPTPPVETLKTPADTAVATKTVPSPPAETRAPVPAPKPAAVVPVAAPAPAAAAAPVAAPVAAALREPAGNGFVVQVAAVNQRGEADSIARRLSSKGYPAFVTTPANAANVFRVRVGKYTERREAEAVAGRLEKEEQFKPWITR
jgi:cell division septation protein DedD